MAEPEFPKKINRREALVRIGSCMAGLAGLPLIVPRAWASRALREPGAALARPSGQGSGPKPNLILIISDDLGYGDLSCFGAPDIITPNLDAIAAQGVRMSQFYAAAPICSPTRTSALTGLYPHRTTLSGLPTSNIEDSGLPGDEIMLPEVLKTAGYATGLFGKWHLGYSPKFRPRRQGFDEYLGELAGSSDFFSHIYETGGHFEKWMFQNDTPMDTPGYLTDVWTDGAKSFISRHKDHPFFLYVAYNAPHAPLAAPDGTVAQTRAVYKAVVERMDAGIGQIMQQLRDLGIEDNTFVFFHSDNGADETSPGSNGILRGGKRTCYEGALRVPCVAKWPGHINPGLVVSEPIISMDVFNTFAAAAGAKIPPGAGEDGRNVLKVLQGVAPTPHDYLCFRWQSIYGARRGKWKLVQNSGVNSLYDLNVDPGENTNLASQQPTIVNELVSRLTQWQQSLDRRTSYIVTGD